MTSTDEHPARTATASLRQRLGCWLNERWRTELALARPDSPAWLDLCNRNETLSTDTISGGRTCHWQDSSELTVSRLFPHVGDRLLSHCLRQWPINLQNHRPKATDNDPEVSVLIAIGGTDRIEQFKIVLRSLQGQSHRSIEIVVVEQSNVAELKAIVPNCVRYFHSKKRVDTAFNKSQALNIAARQANGKYLVIHDGDYVAPRDYLKQCCQILEVADAVRPSRLNFHLSHQSTVDVISGRNVVDAGRIESAVQNNPTPIAVRKDVYWSIGGHDESFEGWGGEDVEFLSRLRTKNVSEGGWMPIVHLWHPPAPKKKSGDRNQQLQNNLLRISPSERIKLLTVQQSHTKTHDATQTVVTDNEH